MVVLGWANQCGENQAVTVLDKQYGVAVREASRLRKTAHADRLSDSDPTAEWPVAACGGQPQSGGPANQEEDFHEEPSKLLPSGRGPFTRRKTVTREREPERFARGPGRRTPGGTFSRDRTQRAAFAVELGRGNCTTYLAFTVALTIVARQVANYLTISTFR